MNNESSFLYSLIEVEGDDFPGFLFMVSDVIVKSGLDIWNAKISTRKGKVSDTFYVKRQDGGKVESLDSISRLRAKMRNAFKLMEHGLRPPYRTARI